VLLALLVLGACTRNLDRKHRLTDLEFGRAAQLFFVALFVLTGATLARPVRRRRVDRPRVRRRAAARQGGRTVRARMAGTRVDAPGMSLIVIAIVVVSLIPALMTFLKVRRATRRARVHAQSASSTGEPPKL